MVVSHLAKPDEDAGRDSGLARWENGIFPALQYMVPDPNPIFVVMLRNYTERFNTLMDANELFQNNSHRIRPVYVDCLVEEKKPRSLCCKQEQGLVNFYDLYYHDKNNQPKYDWIIFQDDDTYIRHKELQSFLPSNMQNEAIVASTDGALGHFLGLFGVQPATAPYKCSTDPQWRTHWGQPLLYNQPAFELMVRGCRLGGLVQQCIAFDTYHDVGSSIVHWMFGFRWLSLHGVNRNTRMRHLKDSLISYHGIGRAPWNYTMQDMHAYFQRFEQKEKTQQQKEYVWSSPHGYSNSSHFQQYNSPRGWTEEWHTFRIADCGAGQGDKRRAFVTWHKRKKSAKLPAAKDNQPEDPKQKRRIRRQRRKQREGGR